MLENWIINQIDPLVPAPLILLRDPQRIIQKGAWVVDGWAEEHGYSVMFCTGNLGLREMVEAVRDDAEAHILLIDRSRTHAKTPLFYPDLDAQTRPHQKLRLSLRDFLVQQTGDTRWPQRVEERNFARLILENLPGTLESHRQLRQRDPTRFTDTDLQKIVLGAALNINPFKALTPSDIRRICIEQHDALEALKGILPDVVMDTLYQTIANAPTPFCYLLDRNPDDVIRAFTLAAILHQHSLEYQVLLSNLDPALQDYRDIAPEFLEQAMQHQLSANIEHVLRDVRAVESFLSEDPARLAFLLQERLSLDTPTVALAVLQNERLSPLLRSLALFSLLMGLLLHKDLNFHQEVCQVLAQQTRETPFPALRRPSEDWQTLERTYRRAFEVIRLWKRLAKHAKHFLVTPVEALDFAIFDQLWNTEHLNRLDFYTSDLARMLRVGISIPHKNLWPELQKRWEQARAEVADLVKSIDEVQALINMKFQDLYRQHYATWIQQEDAPVVFTHQFLRRMLKAHWDPQSGRKAVIMVFDGLRTDAWDEFLRPVLEERFTVIESRPGSALLPTETHLSRKAIAAGCLPEAFSSQSELTLLVTWLKAWLGHTTPYLDVVKDQDTEASGMTVRYVSEQLEYIVFNFSDKNLHHNPQDLAFIYNTTVREIIRQDVRSVLRELPHDALIFITSDHGFTPMPESTVTIANRLVNDPTDVTYRHALTTGKLEGPAADKVVAFDARQMGIPTVTGGAPFDTVLFPRPGFILRRQKGHRPPDRYSHGGLSLAECMVPMVVMGPRPKDAPLLRIAQIQQMGSVSEDEPLTLEIAVAATRPRLPDIIIALDFSRDEIPMRHEVFCDPQSTYTIQWQPKLGEITAEVRQAGRVHLPLTVVLSYRDKGQLVRISASTDAVVKLDPTRLRRRVDSKLDFLMGKVPKGLKG